MYKGTAKRRVLVLLCVAAIPVGVGAVAQGFVTKAATKRLDSFFPPMSGSWMGEWLWVEEDPNGNDSVVAKGS